MKFQNILKPISFLLLFYLSTSHSQITAENAKKIDSIKTRLLNTTKYDEKVEELYNVSKLYLRSRAWDSASFYAKKILLLNKTSKKTTHEVAALHLLGIASGRKEEYKKALEFMDLSMKTAEKLNDKEGIRTAIYGTGRIHQFQGAYATAITYSEKAYMMGKEIGVSQNSISKNALNLGMLNTRLGNYEKASEIILEGLTFKNKEDTVIDDESNLYSALGILYRKMDAPEKALIYMEKAYEMEKKFNKVRNQIASLNNIAMVNFDLKNYEIAKNNYLQALQLAKENNRGYNIYAVINNGLAASYNRLADVDNAIFYYKESIDAARKGNNPKSEGQSFVELGKIYDQLNNKPASEMAFRKAVPLLYKIVAIAKKNGVKEDAMNSYQSLAMIDSVFNDYKSSLANYKNYTLYKDSLFDELKSKAIQEMETNYEAEKKDKEIELLTTKNDLYNIRAKQQKSIGIGLTVSSVLLLLLLVISYNRYEIKRKAFTMIQFQKEAIEEKNNENILLIKEIHHRVKNNLQIIISLLNAQAYTLKGNQKVNEAIIESHNKIKSLALIHENLYNSNNFIKVSTSHYFRDLLSNIKDSYTNTGKNISFTTSIEDDEIKTTLAIPLGLILTELIANSYKYAFENTNDDCVIAINFIKVERQNTYKLEFFDNGSGFPKNFEIDALKTFGLQMVKGLVDQLDGKIEFRKGKGIGFNIHIEDLEVA